MQKRILAKDNSNLCAYDDNKCNANSDEKSKGNRGKLKISYVKRTHLLGRVHHPTPASLPKGTLLK